MGNFQQSTGITYPLCISASSTRTLYQAYDDLDVSMVIDQDGILRYRGGGVQLSEIKSMIDNLLTTSNLEPTETRIKYKLHQNYPNPFNPSTVISLEIDRIDKVSLKVYDNRGRFIRLLLDNTLNAGKHSISWDGRNNQGESVSAGVYYYTLKTNGFTQTKKMILIR